LWQGHRAAQSAFDLLCRNQAWLELVLAAQDLTCWAQTLLLDDDLQVVEPKTLGYRLWLSPPGWSATPAASSSGCSAPGPGPPRWLSRLPACEPSAAALLTAPRCRAYPVGRPRPDRHARSVRDRHWQPPAAPTTTPSQPTPSLMAASASQPTLWDASTRVTSAS
jgi:hypothetical protein